MQLDPHDVILRTSSVVGAPANCTIDKNRHRWVRAHRALPTILSNSDPSPSLKRPEQVPGRWVQTRSLLCGTEVRIFLPPPTYVIDLT
jgi:hypothetical protein